MLAARADYRISVYRYFDALSNLAAKVLKPGALDKVDILPKNKNQVLHE
jgi:hypothetical protein